MAPDSAKPELFRLAISGRALTYFKLIDATRLSSDTVQSKFRNQFMSKTKQAEIRAELDTLHLSSLRSPGDSDRQALDKLIARLDKLSLMGSADDRKDEPKIRRLHNAIVNEQWTYFALCKLPVVYTYEEMMSILRKSITDLSAFERQRKKSTQSTDGRAETTNEYSNSQKVSPWSDSSDEKPPPLEALFNQRRPGDVKRSCFNCGKDGCLIGKCPDPLNLKRIAANLEKFKKEKADRSKNSKWNSNRINLTELQQHTDDWFDVYEIVVTESLLAQHNVSSETVPVVGSSLAFCIDPNDENNQLSTAFTMAVRDGDPDSSETAFTSLFDMMRTPPSMSANRKHGKDNDKSSPSSSIFFNTSDIFDHVASNPLATDTEYSSHDSDLMMCIPTPKARSVNFKSILNQNFKSSQSTWRFAYTIDAGHYGEVTHFDLNTNASEYPKSMRYSQTEFDGVCVDTGAQVSVCGRNQALAYCKHMQIPFAVRPSQMRFKFGDMISNSMGIMKFRLPCPNGGSIDIDIDIFDIRYRKYQYH